jgi:hypothetical protein
MRKSTPMVGSALAKLARLVVRNPPTPVWPVSRPTGTAMTADRARASRE